MWSKEFLLFMTYSRSLVIDRSKDVTVLTPVGKKVNNDGLFVVRNQVFQALFIHYLNVCRQKALEPLTHGLKVGFKRAQTCFEV